MCSHCRYDHDDEAPEPVNSTVTDEGTRVDFLDLPHWGRGPYREFEDTAPTVTQVRVPITSREYLKAAAIFFGTMFGVLAILLGVLIWLVP